MLILITIVGYCALLLLCSRRTAATSSNDTFFRANKQSPWYVVAFGMIGASISGVTFVSVPGMVNTTAMTYMQTCLGFIVGYILVAVVLLPLYYRLNLTTIYTVLQQRLGTSAYKTGAWFFLLSKMTGAAVRFYVVCLILQHYVLAQYGIPFPLTVAVLVLLIWLYTRRGGIRTLVWTDSLQTVCMLLAVSIIIYKVVGALDLSLGEALHTIANDRRAQWFVVDDVYSKQYFWKQFLAGVFIVVVMTGLDQDMMQKNLTCRTLRDAQKDMCTYGIAFVPANLLFLAVGVLLSLLCTKESLPLPAGDALLPSFAATGKLGSTVVVFFTLGIVAAAFSSADSALTAMTTSYCVDIRERESDEHLRRRVHRAIAIVFALLIVCVNAVGTTSMLDAIYVLCSYTYGPLLGLFAFALCTKRVPRPLFVPCIAVLSPVVCYVIDYVCSRYANYHFGYELLLLNGMLTFAGLYLCSNKRLQRV